MVARQVKARLRGSRKGKPLFSNRGYCAVCMAETTFVAVGPWLRDEYVCARCGTIPRQRAVVEVIEHLRPEWRTLRMHESSPSLWFFRQQCPQYSYSYFFPDVAAGASKDGAQCEDVEKLTFPDESFDVFITQDVMEHVFRPDRALREISRVLVAGGIHIFTTPKHGNLPKSQCRARMDGGTVVHLLDPVYHGNPIDAGGSLVTWDYGADFDQLAQQWAGFSTSTIILRDRRRGIDGEHLEVFVTAKHPVNAVSSRDETSAA
jgi:SAM-dependent methyltransferase